MQKLEKQKSELQRITSSQPNLQTSNSSLGGNLQIPSTPHGQPNLLSPASMQSPGQMKKVDGYLMELRAENNNLIKV